jgi:hypothetical protein
MVWKLWFLQDLDQIWFKTLIWILFESGQGHVSISDWMVLVRSDHCFRPLDLKGSECPRLHCTISVKWTIWCVWSWSGGGKRERRDRPRLGFRWATPARLQLGWLTPVMLGGSPRLANRWTKIGDTRGPRGCGRRTRLRPGEGGRRGWSGDGVGCASGLGAKVDLLQ